MSQLARRIGVLLLVVTLATTGAYVFVYLYRWEWNRAIVSAVLFLAAEVALIGWWLLARLAGVEQRLDGLERDRRRQRLERIQDAAPEPSNPFAWLTRSDRTNVFIPVLMGAGVLLSTLAWVVERVAGATARPVAERGLAARLHELAPPPGGFLAREEDPLDVLRRPRSRPPA